MTKATWGEEGLFQLRYPGPGNDPSLREVREETQARQEPEGKK